MKYIGKIFDRLVFWMEEYNKYKMTALLSREVRSKEELDKILKDLYR